MKKSRSHGRCGHSDGGSAASFVGNTVVRDERIAPEIMGPNDKFFVIDR
jgi:hypothetical protein